MSIFFLAYKLCILLMLLSLINAVTTKPIAKPTASPSKKPTGPSPKPTIKPTPKPTVRPTPKPTTVPSSQPTSQPTGQPSTQPSSHPTKLPTYRTVQNPMNGGAVFATILGVLALIFMVLWIYRKGAQDNNLPSKLLNAAKHAPVDDKDDLEIVSPMHKRP